MPNPSLEILILCDFIPHNTSRLRRRLDEVTNPHTVQRGSCPLIGLVPACTSTTKFTVLSAHPILCTMILPFDITVCRGGYSELLFLCPVARAYICDDILPRRLVPTAASHVIPHSSSFPFMFSFITMKRSRLSRRVY